MYAYTITNIYKSLTEKQLYRENQIPQQDFFFSTKTRATIIGTLEIIVNPR